MDFSCTNHKLRKHNYDSIRISGVDVSLFHASAAARGTLSPTHYFIVLVDVTHASSSSIPCLCLVWLLITQQSILWLLICRPRVLCVPSFASHGSLCREPSWQTRLIDVLGGVLSAIVFLASVRWLRSPARSVPVCRYGCVRFTVLQVVTWEFPVTHEL